MALRKSLGNRPVIYEVVPPRRDGSRFNTELEGIDDVLGESRIAAINIPELMNRVEKQDGSDPIYSPATIPPEEYAMIIRGRKEAIVNIVAPRMKKDEFLRRTHKVIHDYRISNLVVVGKERRTDRLPGPGVLEALQLLGAMRNDQVTIGGICIFDRQTVGDPDYEDGKRRDGRLSEARRTLLKAREGCDFVTSQIIFDSVPALDFLSSYQELCLATGERPLTVFISLTTVPSQSILTLLETLDVVVPSDVKRRLQSFGDMKRESVRIAAEVFGEIIAGVESREIRVPLAVQIDQIGVRNDDLSLQLLDSVYPSFV